MIQCVVERSAVDRQPCTKSAAPWVAVIVLNATSVIQWVVERSAVDRQPCTKSAAPWVANPVQKLQQWGLSTLAKERSGLSTRRKQCGAAACKRRAGNVVARGNSEMGHATKGVIVL